MRDEYVKAAIDNVYKEHAEHRLVRVRPTPYGGDMIEALCSCGSYLELNGKQVAFYSK